MQIFKSNMLAAAILNFQSVEAAMQIINNNTPVRCCNLQASVKFKSQYIFIGFTGCQPTSTGFIKYQKPVSVWNSKQKKTSQVSANICIFKFNLFVPVIFLLFEFSNWTPYIVSLKVDSLFQTFSVTAICQRVPSSTANRHLSASQAISWHLLGTPAIG